MDVYFLQFACLEFLLKDLSIKVIRTVQKNENWLKKKYVNKLSCKRLGLVCVGIWTYLVSKLWKSLFMKHSILIWLTFYALYFGNFYQYKNINSNHIKICLEHGTVTFLEQLVISQFLQKSDESIWKYLIISWKKVQSRKKLLFFCKRK